MLNESKKPIEELIDAENDSWVELSEMLKDSANTYRIIPAELDTAKETLYALQVSTRSYLGSVAYRTGGILFDEGWITLLGAGRAEICGSLTSWNGLHKNDPEFAPLEGMLVVAYDAAGGFFALDIGRYEGTGLIYYFAPDTLEWESTELAYSAFMAWLADGDLEQFYQTFRWKGWQEQVRQLESDQVLSYYPPMWSEEGDGENSSKSPISVKEAWLAAVKQ